ncbi:hypothetical protein CR513_39685, partial [Mucuna pruriens]
MVALNHDEDVSGNFKYTWATDRIRNLFSTIVEYQGQVDEDIEVNAQHISSESSAKAHGNFKISQALKEGAA